MIIVKQNTQATIINLLLLYATLTVSLLKGQETTKEEMGVQNADEKMLKSQI